MLRKNFKEAGNGKKEDKKTLLFIFLFSAVDITWFVLILISTYYLLLDNQMPPDEQIFKLVSLLFLWGFTLFYYWHRLSYLNQKIKKGK
jgi:apolipoprotein N-acyltransferase